MHCTDLSIPFLLLVTGLQGLQESTWPNSGEWGLTSNLLEASEIFHSDKTDRYKPHLPLSPLLPHLNAVADTWCLVLWQPFLEHEGKHHGHTKDVRVEGPKGFKPLRPPPICWPNPGLPISRFLVNNKCLYGFGVLGAKKIKNPNLYKYQPHRMVVNKWDIKVLSTIWLQ